MEDKEYFFTEERRVELHQLHVHREPGMDPLIGRPSISSYLEVDEDTLTALTFIRPDRTLLEAEDAMERSTGTRYDFVNLAVILFNKGMVRSIDDEVQEEVVQRNAAKHKWLHKVQPQHVTWLRSKETALFVMGMLGLWIGAMVLTPDARPHYRALFLFDQPAITMLSVLGGLVFMSYLHELAHFFVARSYGLEAQITFNHRLYMIVMQTDVSNAWTLPRSKRIPIFMAGIAFNLLVASAAGLASFWAASNAPAWMPWLQFLMMLNIFPLALQLLLFARTDLYYVMITALNQRNLTKDSRDYAKHAARRLWWRLTNRARIPCMSCDKSTFEQDPYCPACLEPNTAIHAPISFDPRKKRTLAIYGVMSIAFMALGMALMAIIALPFFARMLNRSWGLTEAAIQEGSTGAIVAAGAAGLIIAIQFAFMAYSLAKMVYGLAIRPAWDAMRRVTEKLIGDTLIKTAIRLNVFLVRRLPIPLLNDVWQEMSSKIKPVLEERKLVPETQGPTGESPQQQTAREPTASTVQPS
ncbi:MAG: M50 family metallopeptidase [Thermoplasmatota archaeon]